MVWNRVDLAEEKIFVHGNQSLGKDFFFYTWQINFFRQNFGIENSYNLFQHKVENLRAKSFVFAYIHIKIITF